MKIDVVTVFPEYLAPLDLSLIGRAREKGLIDLNVHDLRRWTHDVHHSVDGAPAGGGAGMVMKPQPWGECFDELIAGDERPRLLVTSPAGRPFTQSMACGLAAEPWLMFACGRYEGIDQRVVDYAAERMEVTEVSIGDYVLFGGEVAVLAIVEAVARLVPGVLGNAASLDDESHNAGLLEAPAYTRPAEWRGHEIPPVLLSGDHGKVARWRRDQALLRTAQARPDLLERLEAGNLDKRDRLLLEEAGFAVPDQGVAE
ncbi:tRNA (guanosine(37)-N1)-methyltransferase TrmD [Glycomyces sp. TRM65418]|uniref:tRNA (guanosine(37)-N1)-methyltransferase TrmD n=1 Tax=Glycomyces sp. TRM65418 TaxID=2867006 RepID=UPI001CE61E59|nr:tRNA (guanosine(37)-N1)-methyltransferase TrmD [Glycomyces sp. TRM65418]MCC3762409.1 tRNA (guanosine(37)-N1)-methyltransferase TrmD [Glycomyces sp. TRM65418]QZD56454.1 tRNA (guanosine(37)-N1)-methyltransferase TrmD [Glycomyces sp. TRM65418]